MTDPTQGAPTAGAQPWYKSPVYVSAISAAVGAAAVVSPKVAAFAGLATPDNIQSILTLVGGGVALVGSLFASIKRAASKLQPLTLTKAAAAVHPATIAAQAQAKAQVAGAVPVAPPVPPSTKG